MRFFILARVGVRLLALSFWLRFLQQLHGLHWVSGAASLFAVAALIDFAVFTALNLSRPREPLPAVAVPPEPEVVRHTHSRVIRSADGKSATATLVNYTGYARDCTWCENGWPLACPSPSARLQPPPGRHEHEIGLRVVDGVRLSDALLVVRDEECPCRTGQHVKISGDVW